MGGIAETAPYWLGPAISGIGAGLSHGSGAEGQLVPAWGTYEGGGRRAPTEADLGATALGGVMRPTRELMGTTVGLMRQPIIVDPLASVQNLPGFHVQGGAADIRVPGKDQTQWDPAALGRSGLNVGSTLGTPYSPYAQNIGTIPQEGPPRPKFGGGIPETQNALNLLTESKIDADTFTQGLFNVGDLFTGAAGFNAPTTPAQNPCGPGLVWDQARGYCMPIDQSAGGRGTGPNIPSCDERDEIWDVYSGQCIRREGVPR